MRQAQRHYSLNGRWAAGQDLLERVSHLPEDTLPVAEPGLAEEPHGRVPGCGFASMRVTPIAHAAKGHPDGHGQAPRQVGNGRIGSNHQVKLGNERGCLCEVALSRAE